MDGDPLFGLAPRTTALLIIDMIHHQLTPGEGFLGDLARQGTDVGYFDRRVRTQLVPNLVRLAARCRALGATVAHVRVGAFREDYSDLVPSFREAFASWGAREGSRACAPIDALRPAPGDIDLVKTGSGAFNGSGLDSHFRNIGIRDILYAGVITNGCVLLSAAAGFDLGYTGHLVTDATATLSDRLQQAAEEAMALYVAKPLTTEEAIRALERAACGKAEGGPSRYASRRTEPTPPRGMAREPEFRG